MKNLITLVIFCIAIGLATSLFAEASSNSSDISESNPLIATVLQGYGKSNGIFVALNDINNIGVIGFKDEEDDDDGKGKDKDEDDDTDDDVADDDDTDDDTNNDDNDTDGNTDDDVDDDNTDNDTDGDNEDDNSENDDDSVDSDFAPLKVLKADVVFNNKDDDSTDVGVPADRFKVKAGFVIGEDSNGFDLSVEEVTVSVGTEDITIPANSFTEKLKNATIATGSSPISGQDHEDHEDGHEDDDTDDDTNDGVDDDDVTDDDTDNDDSEDDSGSVFEGDIDGAKIKTRIKEIDIKTFEFDIDAENVDLDGSSNPIHVILKIGDDVWAGKVKLLGEIHFRLEGQDDEDDTDSDDDNDADDDSNGEDSDGDGVADADDSCQDSDMSETVKIGECETGVSNEMIDDGCNITDLINKCANDATHGEFMKCVNAVTNKLVKDKVITGKEKGKIIKCASGFVDH